MSAGQNLTISLCGQHCVYSPHVIYGLIRRSNYHQVLNVTQKTLISALLFLSIAACSGSNDESAAQRVNDIAQEFVDGYYAQYPGETYEVGYPEVSPDHFGDPSQATRAAWDANVDSWMAALNQIDIQQLAGPEQVTYVFARERMQAIIDLRICHTELWNISPTWTGWPYMFASTLAVQPVATAADREAVIGRITDVARYLQTEMRNLRRGQDQGYVAATSNVAAVAEKITALIDTPTDDSPFFSPAARSDDAEFVAAYRNILETTVIPAFVEYRDFLVNDYVGRDAIGVGGNPDGDACYAASVRFWSSISMDPMDIHRAGLSQMARIQSEMLEIAKTSFDTDDVPALLTELRTNPKYTFPDEATHIKYVTAAVERGKAAAGDWFGNVPDDEMIIVPSPPYDKDSGGGFYSSGSADGSRPAIYQLGTYNPQGISQAGQEATAFHESYPGHHLQGTVATSNKSLHPILHFMYVSGSAEGWALYTERLADEMGLYSDDVARLGMLSNEAYRAARLVVDPGIHVMGWSRNDAIEYMLQHTAESRIGLESEIDRYTAVPGQATSYLLGSMEIQRLRKYAEDTLGENFDIREFHDRMLINGGVTLPMLAAETDHWINEKQQAGN
jgi:uncharacterized protein (DUF885 family)